MWLHAVCSMGYGLGFMLGFNGPKRCPHGKKTGGLKVAGAPALILHQMSRTLACSGFSQWGGKKGRG